MEEKGNRVGEGFVYGYFLGEGNGVVNIERERGESNEERTEGWITRMGVSTTRLPD